MLQKLILYTINVSLKIFICVWNVIWKICLLFYERFCPICPFLVTVLCNQYIFMYNNSLYYYVQQESCAALVAGYIVEPTYISKNCAWACYK